MLKQMIVQETRDLKRGGYSLNEVSEFLERRLGETPSKPTIREYCV